MPLAIAITTNFDTKALYIDGVESTQDDIIPFLVANFKADCLYFCHNLSFDALILIPLLKRAGLLFRCFVVNSNIYSLSIKLNEVLISIRCSYQLTLLPLSKLALLNNSNKKAFPYRALMRPLKKYIKISRADFNTYFDYADFSSKNGHIINWPKIVVSHCISDAELTKKSLIKYINLIEILYGKLGRLPISAPSLSMHIYFKKFNKSIRKTLPIALDRLIRKAYYGGRCEVFGNLYKDEVGLHFDFVGMYASCMEDGLPAGNLSLVRANFSLDDLSVPGFYCISFEQDLHIPILPTRINKKLFFLNGKLRG